MPPEGCLVVLSRSDPPASMARLRANRELEVVGWSELRLTRKESDAIIDQWDDRFSDFAREQLYDKTQGWAASLILMLDQAATDGHVAELPELSSEQLIFDYLAGRDLREIRSPDPVVASEDRVSRRDDRDHGGGPHRRTACRRDPRPLAP